MKKITKIISLVLAFTFIILITVSCTKKVLSFTMSDLVVTFDNQIHSLTVNEEIPDGVQVAYENNDQTNAGEYTVTATISDPTNKYKILTEKLSASLIIEKANYDLSSVHFNDKKVPFDGKTHSIEIDGILPEGVSVSYENNTLSETGSVIATAHFRHNNSNYNDIDDMTAVLTVYSDGNYLPVYFITGNKEIKKIVKKGTILTDIPKIEEKVGYTAYWDYDFSKPITKALKISLVYDIMNFNVNYHLPEGVINSINNPLTFNINSNTIVLDKPISNYHTHFVGFYTTPDFKEDSFIDKIDPTLLKNIDLYAQYKNIEISDFTKFELKDDFNLPILTYKASDGETTVNLSEMLLVDNNFKLFISSDLEGKDILDSNIVLSDQNNICYAHVTDGEFVTTYKVVITKDQYVSFSYIVDGIIVSEGKVIINSVLKEGFNFEKTGYHLLGYKLEGKTELVKFPYQITENTKFFAVFEAKTYTITYDFNGGTYETNKQLVTYDEELNLYIPSKKGYKFVQYLLDGEPFSNKKYNIDSDITLVAEYKQVEFNINYYYKNQLLLTEKVVFNDQYLVKELEYENFKALSYNFGENCVLANNSICYNFEHDLNLCVKDKVYLGNDFNVTKALNDEYYITGYIGSESEIIIPDKVIINDKIVQVTAISDSAFYENKYITSVEISDNIRVIGDYAFSRCSKLESIYIPDSVTHIGSFAFSKSTKLESVRMSSKLKYAGTSVFVSTNIKTIKLPDTLLELKDDTFYNCKELRTVELPKYLENIANRVFENCISLENIILPNTVKEVGREIFKNCSSLIEVTLPDSLYKIGEYMFSDCINLVKINIPQNLSYFGYYCFKNCSKLTEFILPDNLRYCYSVIFEGITTNIYNEYENGYYLGTKTNPYKFFITLIDKTASNVIFHKDTKIISGFAFIDCPNIKELIVPEGIEFINNGIFEDNLGIERVILPESLIGVGPHLFNGCSNLKSVKLPETNRFILPSSVFINCTSLEEIIIPNNIYQLGYAVFEGCTSLKKVLLPETLELIDRKAFKNCVSLTSINIPKNITFLPYETFYGCTSLIDFNLEETNIDHIDRNAITNLDTSIYNVYNGGLYYGKNNNPYYYLVKGNNDIHFDTKVIVGGAFMATEIKNIVIPEGVTHINSDAFAHCMNLQTVAFPKSLEFIGYGAFQNCTSLEEITLFENVSQIESVVFRGCDSLKKITINSVNLSLNENVFSSLFNLESITINGRVTFNELTFVTLSDQVLNYYNGVYYIGSSTNKYNIAVRVADRFASSYELHDNCINFDHNILVNTSLALK